MRYIEMKHNRHELPELDDFARRHGFDSVAVRRLYTIDSTTDADLRESLSPVGDLEHRGGRPRDSFICQHPFWFPTVLADGTLVLCEQDYNAELGLGRISGDVSFQDLWRSPKAAQVRRAIRDDQDHVSFCRKCPFKELETADCSVEARDLCV
jgi:radical SAM protein with 4Fe4S-binding SPASM domain